MKPALFVAHVADRDAGSGFDHQPRDRGADAARRAGNQRHLAVETVHRRILHCVPRLGL